MSAVQKEKHDNPSPGLKRNPRHTLILEKTARPVTVRFNGKVIAETRNALTLLEANYKPVYYIPVEDVNGAYLTPSSHLTDCQYKGHAQYWNVEVEGRLARDVVWRYAEPYDEVIELKNYVSFYPNKVEVEVIGL